MTNVGLEETVAAYERARAAAADATTVAKETLDRYVREAIHQKHSTRDIARALGIPKSTVHRIRLGVGSSLPEVWSTPEGYVRANNHAWSETPVHQVDRAPFEVHTDDEGTRHYAISGNLAAIAYPHIRGDQ